MVVIALVMATVLVSDEWIVLVVVSGELGSLLSGVRKQPVPGSRI
jgi:hypothetical protein